MYNYDFTHVVVQMGRRIAYGPQGVKWANVHLCSRCRYLVGKLKVNLDQTFGTQYLKTSPCANH